MPRPRAIVAALALLASFAAGRAPAMAQDGPPPTFVRAVPAKQELLQPRRRVTGELRAVARSSVATIEPGLVRSLPIEYGDFVKAGDVLAKLDQRRLDLTKARLLGRKDVARAVIEARNAELGIRARDLENLERLGQRDAANPKQIADARSEQLIAQARALEAERDLEVLAAELDLIETRIKDKTVTAPFDGVVVRKLTETGQWLGEGEAIAEIVAVASFDAWLNVPQQLAAEIRRADARLDLLVDVLDQRLEDQRPTIVPLLDPTVRTVPAYVRLDNDTGLLAPGMSVTAWIPMGEPAEFITVPRDALLRRDTGTSVFVAGPAGPDQFMAMPAPVVVLFETGGRAAVRSLQIQDGTLVVTEGNERLFPMMPIAISNGPAQEEGPPPSEANAAPGGPP